MKPKKKDGFTNMWVDAIRKMGEKVVEKPLEPVIPKELTRDIKITERAHDILISVMNDYHDEDLTYSEAIYVLYDDYCEANGEPDRETG